MGLGNLFFPTRRSFLVSPPGCPRNPVVTDFSSLFLQLPSCKLWVGPYTAPPKICVPDASSILIFYIMPIYLRVCHITCPPLKRFFSPLSDSKICFFLICSAFPLILIRVSSLILLKTEPRNFLEELGFSSPLRTIISREVRNPPQRLLRYSVAWDASWRPFFPPLPLCAVSVSSTNSVLPGLPVGADD